MIKQGRKLAVVVGVSRYLFGYKSLRYAGADALKVASVLQASGYQVQTLATDRELGSVRRQAVLDAFSEVAQQARSEDTFLFYFSGHGSRHNDRDYLLLSDADPRRFDATALSLDSLGEVLSRCRASQRLFIVDACRDTGLAEVATKGKAVSGFAKGGLPRGFQEKVGTVAQKAPPRLPVRWAALFACSPNQFAKESDEEKSGVFTTRLLEALGGGLGGEVTIEAALRYIQGKMPSSLVRVQRPDMLGEPRLTIASATPNLVPTEGSGFFIGTSSLTARFRLTGVLASHIRTEYIGGGKAPEGALDQSLFYDLSTMERLPPTASSSIWQEGDSGLEVYRRQLGPADYHYALGVFRGERPSTWFIGSRWRILIYAQGRLHRPALVRELECTQNMGTTVF